MTKKQRILKDVRYIKENYVLGAARTAQLETVRQKYEISAERLKAMCLHQPGADFWN